MNFWSFFALLLAANYRDIMLREFLEFFALLLAANYRDIIGFFWTFLATLAVFPFVIWRYLRIGDVIGEFSIDSFNPLSFSTNHSSESIYCIRFDFFMYKNLQFWTIM